MRLYSPAIASAATAGQFVMVAVEGDANRDGILLPRPMAIHRRYRDAGELDIVYDVVGRGTAAMGEIETDARVLITGPLGRGFLAPPDAGLVLLLGRDVGICSVMTLAEDARANG
jgi:dihydroorotate dehydrogenase electron transfer subunit